jgi:hypothetical protein
VQEISFGRQSYKNLLLNFLLGQGNYICNVPAFMLGQASNKCKVEEIPSAKEKTFV